MIVTAERKVVRCAICTRKNNEDGLELGYGVDQEKIRLVVDTAGAKLVRHILSRFCQIGSCMKVAHEFNAAGRQKEFVRIPSK